MIHGLFAGFPMSRRQLFATLLLTLLAPIWALVQPIPAAAGEAAGLQLILGAQFRVSAPDDGRGGRGG